MVRTACRPRSPPPRSDRRLFSRSGTPGRSPHGYGLAIDFGGRIEIEFGTQPYLWLRDNGPRFGWHNMPWNREGGSNPEAWHFDYRR